MLSARSIVQSKVRNDSGVSRIPISRAQPAPCGRCCSRSADHARRARPTASPPTAIAPTPQFGLAATRGDAKSLVSKSPPGRVQDVPIGLELAGTAYLFGAIASEPQLGCGRLPGVRSLTVAAPIRVGANPGDRGRPGIPPLTDVRGTDILREAYSDTPTLRHSLYRCASNQASTRPSTSSRCSGGPARMNRCEPPG